MDDSGNVRFDFHLDVAFAVGLESFHSLTEGDLGNFVHECMRKDGFIFLFVDVVILVDEDDEIFNPFGDEPEVFVRIAFEVLKSLFVLQCCFLLRWLLREKFVDTFLDLILLLVLFKKIFSAWQVAVANPNNLLLRNNGLVRYQ